MEKPTELRRADHSASAPVKLHKVQSLLRYYYTARVFRVLIDFASFGGSYDENWMSWVSDVP